VPQKATHIAIAHDNEVLAGQLDLDVPVARGWASTICFYSALHCVEAFLSTRGKHSADHRTRDSNLCKYPETAAIYDEFSELKNISTAARYMGVYPNRLRYSTEVITALVKIKSEMGKYT
jgi:hypothetical protein